MDIITANKIQIMNSVENKIRRVGLVWNEVSDAHLNAWDYIKARMEEVKEVEDVYPIALFHFQFFKIKN